MRNMTVWMMLQRSNHFKSTDVSAVRVLPFQSPTNKWGALLHDLTASYCHHHAPKLPARSSKQLRHDAGSGEEGDTTLMSLALVTTAHYLLRMSIACQKVAHVTHTRLIDTDISKPYG